MFSGLDEDFFCSVCQDIFKNPVVLSCSHSFCKDCLQSWWRDNPQQECPVCKRRSSRRDPTCNLALKNLCEAFKLKRDQRVATGSESVCSLHGEKLRLFCLDHQQLVCLVCRDSKTHNDHKFRPIGEAAQDHRDELQKHLKPLQEKLKLFEQVKGKYNQTIKHIKLQVQDTEKEIKEQFKKLHQFLNDEEEARITALREEEEQKMKRMKEKIEALSREIATLSDTIRVTEDELRTEDVSFLHSYKAAVNRVQQRLLQEDPEQVSQISGALINVAKHLGNLTYNIWDKMEEMVSNIPVILDPNTAHPELILSADLTTMSRGERQNIPDNPERFDSLISVLGSEGFNSGTYSWDVEVGDNPAWFLGVATKSDKRKGVKPSAFWALGLLKGRCKAYSPSAQAVVVQLTEKLEMIRVNLDWDNGQLTFSNAENDKHIYTFTHSFRKMLFPYFCNRHPSPIKILPEENDDDSDEDDDDYDGDNDDDDDYEDDDDDGYDYYDDDDGYD